MKRRWLLLACLLLVPFGGAAQGDLADDEAIRLLCNNFFDAFRQGGAQGVVAYLRQSGSIEDEVLRSLERRTLAIERKPFIGRPDSFVIVHETQIAGALRYRTVYALTHHDSRPLAWRLRFYKKVTGVWVFTDVQWEEQYVEDFLKMPELEFAAYRRTLERPRSERPERPER
jgi:hypothetical protein